MLNQVKNNIVEHKLIKDKDKIVLGVSGRPDSMFMLYNILEYKKELNKINQDISLYVCHINHNIRDEAYIDENVVRDFCKKNNIEFFLKSVDIPKLSKENKKSEESYGRYVRYEFFKQIYDKFDCNSLMIAHNKNDNCETLLLNIARGTGISRLCGLDFSSTLFGMNVKRPIINIEKKQILEFLEKNNIDYAIDKTNFSTIYRRNKIRNIIIPEFEQLNSKFVEQVDKLSAIAKEETQYINNLTQDKFNYILIEKNERKIILNSKKFRQEDIFMQKKILFFSINLLFGTCENIQKVHIDDIIQMINKNVGNKYLTPNSKIKVYINNGKIEISKQENN